MLFRTMAGALIALSLIAPASAQNFPSKPIRIIVPFAPGGSVDLATRPVAQVMQEVLGQPVVVDYRTGANSRIGTEYVAHADPDGHTLLTFSGSFMVNPSTYRELPYDTLEDFTPVSLLGNNANVLIVSKNLGVSNLEELVELAKSRPGELTYGSSGIGGPLHLAAVLFTQASETEMLHIPYRGTGEMYPDVVSGIIDMAVVSIPSGLSFIQNDLVLALAVTGDSRAASLPDVPTLRESGVDLETSVPYGLVAPAGTPPEVIDILNDAVRVALESDLVKDSYAGGDLNVVYSTPEEAAEFIRTEMERYAKVVEDAGVELVD